MALDRNINFVTKFCRSEHGTTHHLSFGLKAKTTPSQRVSVWCLPLICSWCPFTWVGLGSINLIIVRQRFWLSISLIVLVHHWSRVTPVCQPDGMSNLMLEDRHNSCSWHRTLVWCSYKLIIFHIITPQNDSANQRPGSAQPLTWSLT